MGILVREIMLLLYTMIAGGYVHWWIRTKHMVPVTISVLDKKICG